MAANVNTALGEMFFLVYILKSQIQHYCFRFKKIPSPLVFRFNNIAVYMFSDFFWSDSNDSIDMQVQTSQSTLHQLLAQVENAKLPDMPPARVEIEGTYFTTV
jgi:hypothetical protein